MRKTWQPVALSRDVKDKAMLEYTLLNEGVVIVRLEGKVMDASESCPRRGAKFGIGDVVGDHLRPPVTVGNLIIRTSVREFPLKKNAVGNPQNSTL
jgi:hypothetical protein